MNFLPFASSSAGNFYLARSRGRDLAIECGLPMSDIREVLGSNWGTLDGCLLSHEHGDHALSAAKLMRQGIDVYASAPTWGALGLDGHRAVRVRPRDRIQIGYAPSAKDMWMVMPFDLRHDSAEPLGFYIEAPDGDRLMYACDTAYIPYRFAGLTHVAIECNYSIEALRRSEQHPAHKRRVLRSHMALERVIEALKSNNTSRLREVWLLHLSDAHSDEGQFKRSVEQAIGVPTFIAPRNLRRGY